MHVEQRQVDLVVADQVQRLLPALGHQRMVPLRRDDLAQGLPGDGVVVGDENRIGSVERHEADSHSPKNGSRLHLDTPICTSYATTAASSL